ncbi:hypothetical protein C7S16_5545 [Burkholderia thailandensis]|uniref:Uncharacterized protein n=1 Tax=Burkholderia thailandensis TaxID=57975 RepID=A0AAW9CRE5_BURTH|nr:hypothetical protein [Burkholderia thailandensis]
MSGSRAPAQAARAMRERSRRVRAGSSIFTSIDVAFWGV